MAGWLRSALEFVRVRGASSLFDRGYAIQFQLDGVARLQQVSATGLQIEKEVCYHPQPDDNRSLQSLDVYTSALGGSSALHPVVVFLHGGGWRGSDKDDPFGVHGNVCRSLAQRGLVAVNVNYRLAPQAKHPATVRDAAHAVSWVSEAIQAYKGDPQQIFVSGHSAGGHLAALVALDPRYLKDLGLSAGVIKGVIGISGIYNVAHFARRNWMAEYLMTRPAFGKDSKARAVASPVNYARAGAPPFLLLNAREDGLLEEETEELAAALRSKGVFAETAVLPGTNHFSILSLVGNGNDSVVQRITQFVEAVGPGQRPLSKGGLPGDERVIRQQA